MAVCFTLVDSRNTFVDRCIDVVEDRSTLSGEKTETTLKQDPQTFLLHRLLLVNARQCEHAKFRIVKSVVAADIEIFEDRTNLAIVEVEQKTKALKFFHCDRSRTVVIEQLKNRLRMGVHELFLLLVL